MRPERRMSGTYWLDCPECDEPLFQRGENSFSDGEVEMCKFCGFRCMVSCDSENAPDVVICEESGE